MTGPVLAVILAAGESSRMGRPKQLLPWRGRPMVAHVASEYAMAWVDHVAVVAGHMADEVEGTLFKSYSGPKVTVVRNPDYKTGMLSSVRVGLSSSEAGVYVIGLCDQPMVDCRSINAVIDSARAGLDIVVPVYGSRKGHPIAISRRVRDYVLWQVEAQTLRDALVSSGFAFTEIQVDCPGTAIDLDCEEDYRNHSQGG